MSLLDKASLILVPGAPQKASEIWAAKPVTQSIGVTRGTTKFRTNSAGLLDSVAANVAALDYLYGGSLQSCPLWFVEGAATNLVLRSQEFGNAYWTPIGSSVSANTSLAPDGTTTMDRLTEDATAGIHTLFSSPFTIFFNQVRTSSIFVKKGNVRYIQLLSYAFGDSSASAIFDLDSKIVTDFRASSGSGPIFTYIDSAIEEYDGILRLSLTSASTFDNTTFVVAHSNVPTFASGTLVDGIIEYSGNPSNFTDIWGAQVELGSKPTSYIPTTSSAVTRNADVISQGSLSSYIGQTAGAVAGSFVVDGSGIRTVAVLSDGTTDNIIHAFLFTDNSLQIEIYQGGSFIASAATAPLTSGKHSYCLTYAQGGNLALYVDGSGGVAEATPLIPSCSQLRIGSFIGGIQYMNGHIGAHVLANQAISESEAINLSLMP